MENNHLYDALTYLGAAQEAIRSGNQLAITWKLFQAIDEIKKEIAKREAEKAGVTKDA